MPQAGLWVAEGEVCEGEAGRGWALQPRHDLKAEKDLGSTARGKRGLQRQGLLQGGAIQRWQRTLRVQSQW